MVFFSNVNTLRDPALNRDKTPGAACCVSVTLLFWLAIQPALAKHGNDGRSTQTGLCKHTENLWNSGSAPSNSFIVPLSIEDGSVVVDVTINGSEPLPMLLDTGSSLNAIAPKVAAALRLNIESDLVAHGTTENAMQVASTHVGVIHLADVQIRDQPFLILALPSSISDRGTRPPLVGILGSTLLTNFVAQLDYHKRRLVLTTPANFHYVGAGICVPLVLTDGVPSVLAKANRIEGQFAIDTGSNGGLMLKRTFIERNGLQKQYAAGLTIKNLGVDDLFETIMTRIERFEIANSTIVRPLVQFPVQLKEGLPVAGVSGSVGSKILQQFVITFDYSRHELWFKRSSLFGGKYIGNTTGFQALKIASSSNFRVVNVIANTPAAAAGVKLGDLIVDIDGVAAAAVSPTDLSALMARPDGTAVHLGVLRDTAYLAFTLTLRELVP